MHPKNPHSESYNFTLLIKVSPSLKPFVITTNYGNKSINFSDSSAVFELNKALLNLYYGIKNYNLPENYLIPPVPGRADYLWHINDLLIERGLVSDSIKIKGLDIGTGANGIYPILAVTQFNWEMVGVDIDPKAVEIAQKNTALNSLNDKLVFRHQPNPSNLFTGIIASDEKFHFTMCNPPFHASAKEAAKEAQQKISNLKLSTKSKTQALELNFNGQANELWCNGGEALFIKRLIKQSILYKNQVSVFTTLVAKSTHLPKLHKQLQKINAEHTTIDMEQGNKKSRFIAWWF